MRRWTALWRGSCVCWRRQHGMFKFSGRVRFYRRPVSEPEVVNVNPNAENPTERTTIQFYRDLLRTVGRIAENYAEQNPELPQLYRNVVTKRFYEHIDETDPEQISIRRAEAKRILTNYALHTTTEMIGDKTASELNEEIYTKYPGQEV
eukprot:TRINITY_DN5028_c0_g1_i2.p1 TRINITY_DN5028_c0_g1~~TRINITY_DN5028_c0_g1_i2.p1  ORF type:complete len:149 (-),score=14.27 TRINITY_DN5028_c0_g1_i2:27-473(-)